MPCSELSADLNLEMWIECRESGDSGDTEVLAVWGVARRDVAKHRKILHRTRLSAIEKDVAIMNGRRC
jgi:hypothetical protein